MRRDQFEHLYEDVLKQESEWKGKYDKAQMQVAEMEEAMGEVSRQETREKIKFGVA